MEINNANYYSPEANWYYMSVSQFKAFGKCEAAAMAELRGEYIRPKTTALLVGSYVDSWFEGTLEQFRAENPEIFKRDGSLKADFVQAEQIIKRVQQDALFMEYMSGKKQRIFTGELFGAPWKIKVDSLHHDKIVDLKVIRTLEPIMGENFVEYWGYDLQGGIYQAIEGHWLPFYIAAVTKEDPADMAVIHVPEYALHEAREYVRKRLPRILAVKSGEVEAERCEKCAYCRATKKLTRAIEMEEIF